MRSFAVALFLLSICSAAEARKIGLAFNGGGDLGEGPKNAEMERETTNAIRALQREGYNFDGNVFLRDGGQRADLNLRNQSANATAFLDRLRQTCSTVSSGDEVFISFAGHGGREVGTPVTDNHFFAYQEHNINPSIAVSSSEAAKIEGIVSRLLATHRQGVLTSREVDGRATYERAMEPILRDLAQQLNISIERARELTTNFDMSFDLQPQPFSAELKAKVAKFLVYGAQNADKNLNQISREFFSPTEDLTMAALKPVIEQCASKGARVRMTATNCFSGGLLALTNSTGPICALSQTGPYNVSVNFDLWGGENRSLSEMRTRAQSNVNEVASYINNDPVSSSDFTISKWVDELRENCQRSQCILEGSRTEVCSAFNREAPGYFRTSEIGRDSRRAPDALVRLAGELRDESPVSPQLQNRPELPVDARSEAIADNLKASGFDVLAPSISTTSELDAQLSRHFSRIKDSPDQVLALKALFARVPIFGGAANAYISETGQITNLERFLRAFREWALSYRSGAEARRMVADIGAVEQRKQVYKQLFEKYATGSCREQFKSAQACEAAPLSGGSSGRSQSAGGSGNASSTEDGAR